MRITGFIIVLGLFIAGCAATPDEPSMRERQDQAVADPMHYSVDMTNTDISSGGISGYDAKAMKRDMDALWNP